MDRRLLHPIAPNGACPDRHVLVIATAMLARIPQMKDAAVRMARSYLLPSGLNWARKAMRSLRSSSFLMPAKAILPLGAMAFGLAM